MAKNVKKTGKVRWGVVSTANIGVQKVIPSMMKSKTLEIRAIASRSLPRAKRVAAKLGIPTAYGSYEELLDDPEIDAIYNPLPNHLHVPVTLQAARKGKHVLCEKPIALTAAEARKLRRAPKDILIAEAFMVRAHPQWLKARDLVQSGKLGDVRMVQATFAYNLLDPNNVRNMADIGGGGIYDIGCYPIVTARFVLDAEPRRVVSLIDRDPTFRTDRTTSALIDFGEGRQLAFTISTQATAYQRMNFIGTKGRLEIRIPFNAPPDEAMLVMFDSGKKLNDESARTIRIRKSDQYQLQGEAFSRAVRGEENLAYGVEDAVQQMRILDALFASAKRGAWVKL
ncbi:MAG: Gfo/Idh/MocA family protein [Alphaproteobacteria bacterium]